MAQRSLSEGPWQGRVTHIFDPLNEGRIRVEVPDVLGDCPSTWARPKDTRPTVSYSPSVGDGVWVEFQNGDIESPVWSGRFLGSMADNPLSPEERLAPDRVVLLRTPGGQSLKLTDLPDTLGLVLESSAGAKIEITATGIVIDNGAGAKIELTANEVSINGGALSIR